MSRLVSALVLFMLAGVVSADGWAPTSSTASGNTAELRALGRVVTVFWPTRVMSGEDILLIKAVDSSLGVTFYLTYELVGVVGNTLRINSSGSVEEKGQKAKPDRSFSKELYFERSSDGDFFLTTADIKSNGYFRIARASDRSPYYTVSLVKEPL